MTNEELTTPPTALEVAELLAAASRPDYHLSKLGLNILRRLAFDRDRLQTLVHDLQQRCDPAGATARLGILENENRALQVKIAELKRASNSWGILDL